MKEQQVPTIGTVWVEHATTYFVECLDEDGTWDTEFDELYTAGDVIDAVKELLEEDEVAPEKIRIVETLKIRRVMLGGELEARAKRERGEV